MIFLLLKYLIIAITGYNTYAVCSREHIYKTLLAKWEARIEEAGANELVEPDPATDVFNLLAETDQPADSYDEIYTTADFMDFFFVIMQGVNIGIAGYGVYTALVSSFYWFAFGRNISTAITSIYNVVMAALDWRTFVYKRHRITMLIDHLKVELGEAPA